MTTTTTTRAPYHGTANELARQALEQLGHTAQAWRGAIKASARKVWGGAYLLRASYFKPMGHHHYRTEEEAVYRGANPVQALAAMLLRVIPSPELIALRGEREHLFRRMLAAQEAGVFNNDATDAIDEASSTPLNCAEMGLGDIAFWRGVLDYLEGVATAYQGAEPAQEADQPEALAA